jgi:ParB-like chromosome segregation protein Spo0J
MRVIDGMHRLHAAKLKGAETIPARFFDGDEDAAFVLAVESNVRHGLPLSLADRKRSALRLILAQPERSDRSVAAITGLAHKTVGTIRRRAAGEIPHLPKRIGRDGRSYPLHSVDGRRRASEMISNDPDVAIREVAQEAGISLSTAKDVRQRMRRGDDPLPPNLRNSRIPVQRAGGREQFAARMAAVRGLLLDPSLRLTDLGRTLLRWLDTHHSAKEKWEQLADTVPEHCLDLVVEVAHGCVRDWQQFAARLERRAREQPPEP